MTSLEKRLLSLALLFGLLTLGVVAARGGDIGFPWQAPEAHASGSGTYYGANDTWAQTAASDWPQQQGNWCGVANIEMIANYTYQVAANSQSAIRWGKGSGGQQKIANDLNSNAAISRWGTAPATDGGPGFKADIAADGGTDPRSIAWGIFYESAFGKYLAVQQAGYVLPANAMGYHNVIYHGGNGIQAAVSGLARTLARYQLPVSLTMAHGLHSDVVTGVYSNNDPRTSWPVAVTSISVWDPDPGTYQGSQHVIWSYSAFTDPNQPMWGTTYNANNIGGVPYDPDPSVGLYTPNGSYPHHWIGNWVDIEPDVQAAVSPDFAMDETGLVMTHP